MNIRSWNSAERAPYAIFSMTLRLGRLPSSSLACVLIQYHRAPYVYKKAHKRIRSENFVNEFACCALEPSVALLHTTYFSFAAQTCKLNRERTSV